MKWRKRLAWGMLCLSAANALRGHLAWQVAPVLAGQVSLSLPLIGAWYLAWGLLWAGLGLLVVRGKALRAVMPMALGYQGAAWLLRWLYDRSDYARALWGRDALLSLLFLGATWWLVRGATRAHAATIPSQETISAPEKEA